MLVGIVATFAMILFGWRTPVHALAVNSLDCSGIDTQDGNVEDWGSIDFLIDTDDTVDGTTYYLQDDGTWTTAEPDDWQYSLNLEKQANIQQMKVCNTDIFLMMLRTEEPMMMVYDRNQDSYVDFWSRIAHEDGSSTSFTLPADYPYWMVWKMQDVTGQGNIIYFAADLRMDAGKDLSAEQTEDDRIPKLYLYEESEDGIAYDDATFHPDADTRLTQISISEDGPSCDLKDDADDAGCQPETLSSKESYAFEVSQDISELFQYADFKYGDTVNMSAAMYNADEFAQTSGRRALQVVDATETQEYTFSQQAVRSLAVREKAVTDRSARLQWKTIKKARSYQMKLLNPKNDQTVRVIKNIRKNTHTVRALKAATNYRAIVRAVLPPKNGKGRFSAWSSGVRWTTEE